MADLTTLLSKFLNDLYAGTLGVTMPISKVLVGDGTAAAPSYSFANAPTVGVYLFSAGNLGVTGNLLFSGAHNIGDGGGNSPVNIYAESDFVAASTGSYQFSGRGYSQAPADGVLLHANNAGTGFTRLILGTNDASGVAWAKSGTQLHAVTGNGASYAAVSMDQLITNNATAFLVSGVALTNSAAAQVATITNAPTAGNPTKWIAINDNGTTRYFPVW